MRNSIYMIWDKVAEQGGPLFEAVNDNVAVRSVSLTLSKVQSIDDYELLCIGEIDNETLQGFLLDDSQSRKIDFSIRRSPDNTLSVLEVKDND